MPSGKAIAKIAKDGRWNSATQSAAELFTAHSYSYYFDQLSQLYHSIDIWASSYIHIFESQLSILEMMRSTGLKPYLDRLENEADKSEFESLVLAEIKKAYPLQKNGKVLFPFKRLFFIAQK